MVGSVVWNRELMQTLRARVSMPKVNVYMAEAGTLVNALDFPSTKPALSSGFSFHPSLSKRLTRKRKFQPAELTCNANGPAFPNLGHLQDYLWLSPTSLLGCLPLFFSAPCQLIHISWFGKQPAPSPPPLPPHPHLLFWGGGGKTSWVDSKDNC